MNEILLSLTFRYRYFIFQVNKGPVDAMSHEARYSLSEEKLIRQQVDNQIYRQIDKQIDKQIIRQIDRVDTQNKGPVDAMSHEARYSLSEEKLIRQQVDNQIDRYLDRVDRQIEKVETILLQKIRMK